MNPSYKHIPLQDHINPHRTQSYIPAPSFFAPILFFSIQTIFPSPKAKTYSSISQPLSFSLSLSNGNDIHVFPTHRCSCLSKTRPEQQETRFCQLVGPTVRVGDGPRLLERTEAGRIGSGANQIEDPNRAVDGGEGEGAAEEDSRNVDVSRRDVSLGDCVKTRLWCSQRVPPRIENIIGAFVGFVCVCVCLFSVTTSTFQCFLSYLLPNLLLSNWVSISVGVLLYVTKNDVIIFAYGYD